MGQRAGAPSSWGLEAPRGAGWWERAACKGMEWLWMPELTKSSVVHRFAQMAVHICRVHCPVLAQCTKQTEEFVPVFGVQAGLRWRQPPDSTGPMMRQPAWVPCGDWCKNLLKREGSHVASKD